MTTDEANKSFKTAQTFLKIQGIISIVSGSFLALCFLLFMGIWLFSGESTSDDAGLVALVAWVFVFFFVAVPAAYYLISGIILVRNPEPSLARKLSITNIVIGALYSWLTLAFGIVNVVQGESYKAGYKHTPSKKL